VNNKQRQGVRDSIDAIVKKSGIDFVQKTSLGSLPCGV
jgi:hypothetical protein